MSLCGHVALTLAALRALPFHKSKEGTFYHNHYAFVLIPYGDLLG